MEKEQLKDLFKKYRNGTCTEAEKAILEHWYLHYNEHETDLAPGKLAAVGKQIFHNLPGNETSFLKRGTIIALAAVFIGLAASVTVGIVFRKNTYQANIRFHDIPPGADKAILTLAGGVKINLAGSGKGQLATQGNVSIIKNAGGQLTYRVLGPNNPPGAVLSNNITTPKSGQWFLVLPDGTKVWLNNASSFTFPSSFSNQKERVVQLTGEAYFEVFKDKAHPFVVKTGRQEVRVLGTRFNINGFTDEPAVKTTLLEGRIAVIPMGGLMARVLRPGQESVFLGNSIAINDIDPEEAVAWKNGYFRFNDENIQSIMRRLARWYDIDVRYEGTLSIQGLNGKISRFKNISQVLKALEATGTVRFKAEGRRVTVMM
jgi:transmembrane sensor